MGTCNDFALSKRLTYTEHGAKVTEEEVKSDNVSEDEGAFPTSVKVPTGK